MSFRWAFNFGNPLPSNAIQQDVSSVTSQLFIENVTQNNAGAYFCMATYSDGNTESAFAHLIFMGKMLADVWSLLTAVYECTKVAFWFVVSSIKKQLTNTHAH